MTVRSVRNNNPGNLNAGQPWQGLQPPDKMTPDQRTETRFAVFRAPEWGFRALCKVLLTYETMYGLNTIRKIISRWAPPSENNTTNYINRVVHYTGEPDADAVVNLRDGRILAAFAKAISEVEAGGLYYSDDVINKGASLALQG